jgi:hypothetical protein
MMEMDHKFGPQMEDPSEKTCYKGYTKGNPKTGLKIRPTNERHGITKKINPGFKKG